MSDHPDDAITPPEDRGSATPPVKCPCTKAFERYKEGVYCQRVTKIMQESGMGDGDIDMILGHTWDAAWYASKQHALIVKVVK